MSSSAGMRRLTGKLQENVRVMAVQSHALYQRLGLGCAVVIQSPYNSYTPIKDFLKVHAIPIKMVKCNLQKPYFKCLMLQKEKL